MWPYLCQIINSNRDTKSIDVLSPFRWYGSFCHMYLILYVTYVSAFETISIIRIKV